MPDYNKGDFTQQGIDGFVEGGLHLNEKRCLTAKISTDEDSAGLDSVEINIHDHLNDLDYTITGENLSVGENALPSGNIEITENTVEGESLDIAQYATATVTVDGGMDFVIPEQTVSTTASGNVSIQTNFQEELLHLLPGNIVIKMIGEAFGQTIHGLAVMEKTQTGNNTVAYTTEIAFGTSTIRINIITVDSGENWGMNIQVDNVQTAFENIYISAIEEWSTTPV